MDYKTDILKCLKIAQVELEGVIGLLEKHNSLYNLTDKISVITSAMRKADQLLLQKHVRICVGERMKKNRIEKSISEIMVAYKYARKT